VAAAALAELWQAVEGTGIAAGLRGGRWGYAGVSAAHVLGIALLVGAVVPLDLHRLGGWPAVPRGVLRRVLVPVAASGLALAVTAGVLLFSVRATEYAAIPVVPVKVALVLAGTANAVWGHLRAAGPSAVQAAVSLVVWLAVLGLGRSIAFVG